VTDDENQERLMRERKKIKKDFDRQHSHKHNRVPSSWRKARGTHSQVRLKKKHAQDMPDPGYRAPEEVRGLHPSGYEDVLVHRPDDLDDLDPETEAARIASKVGGRKREAILDKADALGVTVLNHTLETDDDPQGDEA